jgi:actin-related protein
MAAGFDAVLSNPAVVIDNGGGVLKAGLAGEEAPKLVMQSLIGRPKHERIMTDSELDGDR